LYDEGMSDDPRRRRFRFRLDNIFWLVLVIALGMIVAGQYLHQLTLQQTIIELEGDKMIRNGQISALKIDNAKAWDYGFRVSREMIEAKNMDAQKAPSSNDETPPPTGQPPPFP
jgi:hypothetical protein